MTADPGGFPRWGVAGPRYGRRPRRAHWLEVKDDGRAQWVVSLCLSVTQSAAFAVEGEEGVERCLHCVRLKGGG